MFLYAIFILPEALTSERREELMQANTETQAYGPTSSGETTPGGGYRPASPATEDAGWLVFLKRLNFFKKLAIFLPRRNEETGRRDYRLFLLAISFTIYRIGSMYMNDVSDLYNADCAGWRRRGVPSRTRCFVTGTQLSECRMHLES